MYGSLHSPCAYPCVTNIFVRAPFAYPYAWFRTRPMCIPMPCMVLYVPRVCPCVTTGSVCVRRVCPCVTAGSVCVRRVPIYHGWFCTHPVCVLCCRSRGGPVPVQPGGECGGSGGRRRRRRPPAPHQRLRPGPQGRRYVYNDMNMLLMLIILSLIFMFGAF